MRDEIERIFLDALEMNLDEVVVIGYTSPNPDEPDYHELYLNRTCPKDVFLALAARAEFVVLHGDHGGLSGNAKSAKDVLAARADKKGQMKQ